METGLFQTTFFFLRFLPSKDQKTKRLHFGATEKQIAGSDTVQDVPLSQLEEIPERFWLDAFIEK